VDVKPGLSYEVRNIGMLENVRTIEKGSMKWAEHVARMARREMPTKILWGNPKEDLGVSGRIVVNGS